MTSTDRRTHRRQVVRAAVWTTPVVATAAAAPAFAASPCVGFTFPAMPTSGTSGNGWTRSGSTGISSFGANNFQAGPSYALDADPTTFAAASFTISVPVTLSGGKCYGFSWTYSKYGGNPRRLTCDFVVNGVAQSTGFMDSDVGPDYTSISRSVTYVPATTTTYTVGFRFTFPVGTSLVGDDMTVASPTVTCG